MTSSADPTPRPGTLVLELFRKRAPGSEADFDHKANQYVRRLEGEAPREASFEWGKDLSFALDSLFQVREGRLSAEAKAHEVSEILRPFLLSLGWEETERQLSAQLARRADSRPVHVTFRLGASELFALPWELVRFAGSETRLGEHEGALIRYEEMDAGPVASPGVDPPKVGGGVLFAWAGAPDDIGLDRHLDALAAGFGLPRAKLDSGRGSEILPNATLDAIDDALSKRPAAVLHLLCHGTMQSYRDEGRDKRCACLALQDAEGRKAIVTPPDLRRVMERHAASLRLVVLSVCRGGDGGDLDNALGSPALQIHSAGVPAVVAARYPLPIDDSVALTKALYAKLVGESRSLEEAFVHARRSLRAHPLGWSSLQLFARESDGPDHRPFIVRPYPGFARLEEGDAGFYFGRSKETEEGVAKLSRLVDAWSEAQGGAEEGAEGASKSGLPRFLVVSGAAGAGTPFVGLGLAPAWTARRKDLCREDWSVVKIADSRPSPATLARAEAAREGKSQLLLWLDRLEGAFATGVTDEDREAFFQRLWALAGDPLSQVTVVATVRADFLDRLGEIRIDAAEVTLEEIARRPEHGLPLFRLKSAGLREILEKPAARAGIELDPGLASVLLRDVGDKPGAQPLLEYILSALWEKRRRCGARLAWTLTHDAYEALGGVGEALNRRAEEVLSRMDAVRQRAAQRLLVQLVEVDAGSGRDRRRSVRRGALVKGPDDEAAVQEEVLSALSAAGLVVVDEVAEREGQWGREGDAVELAHDELLRSWRGLRAWLDVARRKNLTIQQLERWAGEPGAVPDGTLGPTRLAWARAVLRDHAQEISEEARSLVERSIAEEERIKRETDAALLREVDQLRRNKSLSIIGGAREVLSRGEPGLAGLLLAEVEQPETSAPKGVFASIARAVLDMGVPALTLGGHRGAVTVVALDPERRFLLTGCEDGAVRVWSKLGVPTEIARYKGPVRAASIDRWGKRFLTASEDGAAHLWRASDFEPLALEPHAAPIVSAAIDPEGRRALTAGADGTVCLWDVETGRALTVFSSRALSQGLRSASFCPGGRRIAALDGEGGFHVWTDAGEPLARWPAGTSAFACLSEERFLLGREDGAVWLARCDGEVVADVIGHHDLRVHAVAAAPDGRHCVTAGAEGTAGLWQLDADSGACGLARVLRGHKGAVLCAAFSADGRHVATGGEDGTARVFAVDDVEAPLVFQRHFGPVRSVQFNSNGRWLVTASDDGSARTWGADASVDPLILRGHAGTTMAAAWSPDGGRLISGAADGTVRLWDLSCASPAVVLSGAEAPVFAVAWSPDCRLVAAAFGDGTVRVWDVATGGPPAVLAGHTGAALAVAFRPDNRWLLTGSADGTARLWEAGGAGAPLVIEGHTGGLTGVAWSPGGERIVTAAVDGTARVWAADRLRAPLAILDDGEPVGGVAFCPEGLRVLTVLPGTGLSMWSADGQGERQRVDAYGGARCAAFTSSEDGRTTGILGFFQDIAVWQVQKDARWVVPLKPPGRPITSGVFSPDRRQLATTSEDRTVTVRAITADLLQERLREATLDCVPPELREIWLGETGDQARARFAEREATKGRAPPVPG